MNHTNVSDLELLFRENPNVIYTKAALAEKYSRAKSTVRDWVRKIQNEEIDGLIIMPLSFLEEIQATDQDGNSKIIHQFCGGYVNYDPSCCDDTELEEAITATIENTELILKGYRRLINKIYRRPQIIKLIPANTIKNIDRLLPGRAAGK